MCLARSAVVVPKVVLECLVLLVLLEVVAPEVVLELLVPPAAVVLEVVLELLELLAVVVPEVVPVLLVVPAAVVLEAVLVLRALPVLLVVVVPEVLQVLPVRPEAAVVCHSQPAASREEALDNLSLLTNLGKPALPMFSNLGKLAPLLPVLSNLVKPAPLLPVLSHPGKPAQPTLSNLVNLVNRVNRANRANLADKVAALPSSLLGVSNPQARRVQVLPIRQRLDWGLSLAPILPFSSSKHKLHQVSLTLIVSTIVLSRCHVGPHELLSILKMDLWERVMGPVCVERYRV